MLLNGDGDQFPENAFYMTGDITEAFEKGRELAKIKV